MPSTVVSSSQSLTVMSGQTSAAVSVLSGGVLGVNAGGIVTNTSLAGTEFIAGADQNTTVLNGGLQVVSAGATAIAAAVFSGGRQLVSGKATGTTLSGVGYISGGYGQATALAIVVSGGELLSAVVGSGGVITNSGGLTSGTVYSGGSLLSSGGDTFATAFEVVLSGGISLNEVVNSGGSINVSSGGSTVSADISGSLAADGSGGVLYGAYEDVFAGGVATGTTLGSGGKLNVNQQGQTSNTLVTGGGDEVVSSGGVTNETVLSGLTLGTVRPNARQFVASGGLALGTVVDSGGQQVLSGGGATNTSVGLGGAIDIQTLGYASGGTAAINSADILTVAEGGAIFQQQLAGSYVGEAFSQSVDSTGSGTLLTLVSAPTISQITPTSGSDLGNVTVTVSGANFNANDQVSIVGVNGRPLAATQVRYINSGQLWATFNLMSLPAGSYEVQVSDSAIATLSPSSFQVNGNSTGQLSVNLALPQTTTAGTQAVGTVTYTNTGATDIAAPLLDVDSTQALLEGPGDTSGSSSIQFLATNPNGPAGILQPGASGTYSFTYTPTEPDAQGNVTISVDAPQPGATINLASDEAALQPVTVDATDWNNVYTQFEALVGTTTDSLGTALSQAATELSQVGQPTSDVATLLQYELFLASGALAGGDLVDATDITGTSSSLSLSLGRTYGGTLLDRDATGWFGDGWTSTYDVTAVTDLGGNVYIQTPDALHVFTPQADGTYAAQSGDPATLTLAGGFYQMSEGAGDTLQFDAAGKLASITDGSGNVTSLTYGSNGVLQSVVLQPVTNQISGEAIRFTSSTSGRITSATYSIGADSSVQTVTYTYNAANTLLLTATGPDGTTTYSYAPATGSAVDNALTSVTNPDGTQQLFTYDSEGRLASQSAGAGVGLETYGYSSPGAVTVTDALGDQTTELYGSNGAVAQVQDALGNITTLQSNEAGELTNASTAGGSTYQYGYDASGNLTSYTDPLGGTASASYAAGTQDLTDFTDQRGSQTQYTHDAAGNVTGITYQDGLGDTYQYNTEGQLTSSTDADGNTTQYGYNSDGELTSKNFSDNTSDTYAYNAQGDLTAATTSTGGTTSYTYDAANRLTSVTNPQGQVESYTYNAQGQLATRTEPDGSVTQYSYDADGRLVKLQDGAGNLLDRYTYNAANQLVRTDTGNGAYTTYQYDTDGNVTQILNSNPDGSVASEDNYTYNVDGLVVQDAGTDGVWVYGYDASGELTTAVFQSADPAVQNRTISYVYDAAGNRISETVNGVVTNYTTNALNEYTAVGGTKYEYDADGNVTSEMNSSGITTFIYNQSGQLVSETGPEGSYQYAYDALGNLVSTTQNGATSTYINDPLSISISGQELTSIAQVNSVTAQTASTFNYGLGLSSTINAGGQVTYFLFNLEGDVTGSTGLDGTITNTSNYLPFGQLLSSTGDSQVQFGLAGIFGVLTLGNGLSSTRARTYDATIGRFLSADPTGVSGGLNLYSYTSNDPINFLDPTGDARLPDKHQEQVGNANAQAAAGQIAASGDSDTASLISGLSNDQYHQVTTIGPALKAAEEIGQAVGDPKPGSIIQLYPPTLLGNIRKIIDAVTPPGPALISSSTQSTTPTGNASGNPVFEANGGVQSGNEYILNLGALTQGDPGAPKTISVLNDVASSADALSGSFAITKTVDVDPNGGFDNEGFDGVASLQAGKQQNVGTVQLLTNTPGTFSEVIEFLPSNNGTGSSGQVPAPQYLVVEGAVRPTATGSGGGDTGGDVGSGSTDSSFRYYPGTGSYPTYGGGVGGGGVGGGGGGGGSGSGSGSGSTSYVPLPEASPYLPPAPTSPIGGANGEPHLGTFTGGKYDFQAVGEFVLAESTTGSSFQVQARLSPLASSPFSVVTQVVIEVGTHRVTFDASRSQPLWIDGQAVTLSTVPIVLAGGTVTQSGDGISVHLATGENVTVSLDTEFSALDVEVALAPGATHDSVNGLLGDDSGNKTDDLTLADGTPLAQPLDPATLYGAFADSWRVTDATSLLDYGPGQDTSTFTDKSFPGNYVGLAAFPSDLVTAAEALVQQAGITDQGLLDAVTLDYLVSGDPSFLTQAANLEQEGLLSTDDPVAAEQQPAIVGVYAPQLQQIESSSGPMTVQFLFYRTGDTSTPLTLSYAADTPDDTFLAAADFSGTLPSGTVTFATGESRETVNITLPNGIGAAVSKSLELRVSAPAGVIVGGLAAQTEVIADTPTEGSPPVFGLDSSSAAPVQSGDTWTLDLGTFTQGSSPAIDGIRVLNDAVAGSDSLDGYLTVAGDGGIAVSFSPSFLALHPGAAQNVINVQADTSQAGTHSETVTFNLFGSNLTGFDAAIATQTLAITSNVTALTPSFTAPPVEPVTETVATALSGISLAELDSVAGETFTVTLTDTDGSLSATGAGVSGVGTPDLTISGTLQVVDAALRTLSYVDESAGSDQINLQATDSYGNTAKKSVAVVNPASNATITGPSGNSSLTATGPGDSASLTSTGNVALSGTFNTGALGVGTAASASVVDIPAGSSVNASSAEIVNGALEASGSGAQLDVSGTVTINPSYSSTPSYTPNRLDAKNGAAVQVGGVVFEPYTNLTSGYAETGVVTVDATSTFEVGSTGGAAPGTITVDAGSAISGYGYLIASNGIVDNGTISALDYFTFGSPVSGTGSVQIESNTTASLSNNGESTVAIDFAGSNGTLDIAPLTGSKSLDYQGTIDGFEPSDTISYNAFSSNSLVPLSGVSYNQTSDTSGVLTLSSGGSVVGRLTLDGNYTGDHFKVTPSVGETYDITVAGDASADFSGTGTSDILFQNTNGTVDTWELSNASVIASTAIANPGTSWHEAGTGDFNGDGYSDILYQNDNGTVAIWEMNGSNVILGATVADPGTSWHALGTGDFNEDGKSDILFQNNDGTIEIWNMNGATVASSAVVANPGPQWHPVGTGDFFGTGQPDILLQNDDGTIDIWQMSGDTLVNGTVIANPGPTWHAVGTGDFNGDGKADIVFQNNNGSVAIWEMNGTSVIASATLANPGPQWHVVSTGDYNGDGKSDILFQNDDGTVATWLMNGATVMASDIIANPGAQWQTTGQGSMHFINATQSTGAVSGTILNDDFVFTTSQQGTHIINSFDPVHDVIMVNQGQFPNYAAVQAAETVANGSTVITLGSNNALTLSGVLPGALAAKNFV
jgi:RHS repeat-associated protein